MRNDTTGQLVVDAPTADPASDRVRVLMIQHAAPCLPALGPARRHYHLVRELAERHDVWVISLGPVDAMARFEGDLGQLCRGADFVPSAQGQWRKAIRKIGALIRGRSAVLNGRVAALQLAVDRMVATQQFDVIVLSTTLLGYLKLPAGTPVVGDTHNVEFDCLARAARHTRSAILRGYYRLEQRRTKTEELAFARRCHAVWTTSSRDKDILQRHLPSARIEVVPNGVNLPEEAPSVARAVDELLFVGLMTYAPNGDGIRWFVESVFPLLHERRPDVRLTVAGAQPPRWLRRLSSNRVTVTGFVPRVEPYLQRATIFVAPLLVGGGTRVKIIEAMANRCPVVSTSVGCEGLGLIDGAHARIADTAKAFAEAVLELLGDAPLRATLALRARARVEQHFQWTHIGEDAGRRVASYAGKQQPPWR